MNGILEALKTLDLKKGTIVTFDQEDQIEKDGKVIDIVDWKYFLET